MRLLRFCLFLCVCAASWSAASVTGCGNPAPAEEITVDATPEKTPEPEAQAEVVVETVPKPPVGAGKDCVQGPRGNDCPKDEATMHCFAVTSTKSICFENCLATNKCLDPTEECRVANKAGQKACYKAAKQGEACSLDQRIRCEEDYADPPIYCIAGKCTQRPSGGWDLGQTCTPPRGADQSDCKAGLSCVELASNEFRCLKACTQESDCPTGETCWDEPLGKKVCLIGAKENQSCERLERRFCKSDDPKNYPLECTKGKCTSTVSYVKLGEICKKDIDPTKVQGNCEPGFICLGVAEFEARCHKACDKDPCPSGETCIDHPNINGQPLKGCILPAAKDGDCDLTKRTFCIGAGTQILRCKDAKCIEIQIGDGCKNDIECGPLKCTFLSATNGYCLVPCNPQAPQCPGNGTCQSFGQNGPFACIPTGPKKSDENCAALQAGGDKLNVGAYCQGGLICLSGFAQNNPAGVCVNPVVGCQAGACAAGRVCVPLQNSAVCAKDCSQDPAVCSAPDTACLDIQQLQVRICGPKI